MRGTHDKVASARKQLYLANHSTGAFMSKLRKCFAMAFEKLHEGQHSYRKGDSTKRIAYLFAGDGMFNEFTGFERTGIMFWGILPRQAPIDMETMKQILSWAEQLRCNESEEETYVWEVLADEAAATAAENAGTTCDTEAVNDIDRRLIYRMWRWTPSHR